MWPSYHKLLPTVNLITVPLKHISTDQVTAREDFNNLLPYFQPSTISISKWSRPLPESHMISIQERQTFIQTRPIS